MKQKNPISSTQLVDLYRRALRQNLSLQKVEAKINKKLARIQVSQAIEDNEEKNRLKKIKKRLPKRIRYGALILPLVFMGVGLFLLGNALFPLVDYYAQAVPKIDVYALKKPIPDDQVLDVMPHIVAQTQTQASAAVLGEDDSPDSGPVILDTKLDYTNLTNWFSDDKSQILQKIHNNTIYTLDIPKIEVEDALVKIGGTNLDENLIAYPGTAFPGELGSPVIFGHSVLRQFYNPSQKNPRRYNSIFSYIMTLEKGDEIFITHDGAKYKYVVEDKTDVKPEDTYILAQQYDDRKLKLVTCVPEGTYLRRGVVTAKLVNY